MIKKKTTTTKNMLLYVALQTLQTEGVADRGYRQEPYTKRLYVVSMLGGKTQSHSTTP